jgi:conjugative relaxase-like TrwC/TraI family protein
VLARRCQGFDLTFSAPKRVSVLFAIDDEHVAGGLLAAHERAVDVAVAYLEQEACSRRRGRYGADGCGVKVSLLLRTGIGCRGLVIRNCTLTWS